MTYALRDSPAFDGSRWLESFEAAACPTVRGWRRLVMAGVGRAGAHRGQPAAVAGHGERNDSLARPGPVAHRHPPALPVPPKSRPPKLSLLRDWAGGHPTPNWAVWTATSREKQPCIEPNEHFGFSLVRPLERL